VIQWQAPERRYKVFVPGEIWQKSSSTTDVFDMIHSNDVDRSVRDITTEQNAKLANQTNRLVESQEKQTQQKSDGNHQLTIILLL